MESTSLVDLLVNPTVFIAVFIGGSALLLVYILKLFRMQNEEEKNQSEQASSTERKKENAYPRQKRKPNWTRSNDRQNFSSPWLLKTLKGHTNQVLSIDYSSSGKYLATCGEEEADRDPDFDMSTSSGSECNKENSRPPSASPSPRTKGLSRRQRKNRRREDSSPDLKKKPKSEKKSEPLIQCTKLNISEREFANLLYPHLLTIEQQFSLGYPVQMDPHHNSVVFYNPYDNKSKFDVNAREFVPNKRILHDLRDNSSDSSEIDSEESSGSEPDLSLYKPRNSAKSTGEERTCVRCHQGFFVTDKEYLTQERCVYHWGKLHTVHKGDPTCGIASLALYSCCRGKPGSVGCTTCKLHVWNGIVGGYNYPLEGFVRTRQRRSTPSDGNYGVYALDCEMCYTVAGLEVTKVTVVGMDGRLVYDTYVKPQNEIVDYNTRFSGITAKDLRSNNVKTLREVQNDLRGFISADTILIGHGLENDMRALKLIHKSVVDTAWSFPHYNGLPYKRSLKSLVSSVLKRQVQNSSSGHDSYEDACACMELMLYKVRKENRGYV